MGSGSTYEVMIPPILGFGILDRTTSHSNFHVGFSFSMLLCEKRMLIVYEGIMSSFDFEESTQGKRNGFGGEWVT